MSALSVFSFSEKLPVRVSVVNDEPWFVAKDIAQCLEYSQASISQPNNLFRAVPDQWKAFQEFETRGGKQKILALSEQGLYFFLGRSDKPKALPFQMWLAGDVLPTIRKTGQYSTRSYSEQVQTLTPAQQHLIRQAVASRAKVDSKSYQTIYRAIYNRFQIARYDQLPQTDLNECLKFIQEVNLNVPEVKPLEDEDKGALEYNPLTEHDCDQLIGFVYSFKYHHRRELELHYEFLKAAKSPYADKFYEMINDSSITSLERILARSGYTVKDLASYQSWMAHHR